MHTNIGQFSEVAEEMHALAAEHDEQQAMLAEVFEDDAFRSFADEQEDRFLDMFFEDRCEPEFFGGND